VGRCVVGEGVGVVADVGVDGELVVLAAAKNEDEWRCADGIAAAGVDDEAALLTLSAPNAAAPVASRSKETASDLSVVASLPFPFPFPSPSPFPSPFPRPYRYPCPYSYPFASRVEVAFPNPSPPKTPLPLLVHPVHPSPSPIPSPVELVAES